MIKSAEEGGRESQGGSAEVNSPAAPGSFVML